MNDKYYIPKLDELHVGYECEIKLEHEEHKGIIYDNIIWESHIIEKSDLIYVSNWIDWNEIRTKYLDIKDIESLGFVNYYIKVGKLNNQVYKIGYGKQINNSTYFVEVNTLDKSVKIYKEHEMVKEDFEEIDIIILFKGKCKSINELKLILKMLEI